MVQQRLGNSRRVVVATGSERRSATGPNRHVWSRINTKKTIIIRDWYIILDMIDSNPSPPEDWQV